MFRLAIVLHKTVEQIEAISSRELSEWLAFSRIDPLPDAHWDAASISYTVASVMSGKGSRPKFSDFLPRPFRRRGGADGSKVQLTPQQTRGLLSKLCGTFGIGGGANGRQG